MEHGGEIAGNKNLMTVVVTDGFAFFLLHLMWWDAERWLLGAGGSESRGSKRGRRRSETFGFVFEKFILCFNEDSSKLLLEQYFVRIFIG